MSSDRKFDKPGIYHIKVKGTLDRKWSDWFDGFDIRYEVEGETLLMGTVRDQAALHGLLTKIRDLGLPLLMVQRIEGEEAKE
jgi:hypothetical protein